MLYYGDRTRRLDPADAALRLGDGWRGVAASSEPVLDAASALLVDAGMLAQGLADAAFEERGADAPHPEADAAMLVCLELARVIATAQAPAQEQGQAHARRARSGDDLSARDRVTPALRRLSALLGGRPPGDVEGREPEGYAHYAVYPESYVAAARQAPPGRWTVIGIRSIGTSAAAAVAAGLGASRVVTVRPIGHPHDRRLALSAELRAWLVEDEGARFAIADEGPGLSGSSFASVVAELEAAGVGADRIHLFPSHGGEPGPAASPLTRERWRRARRHVVTLDDLALGFEPILREWLAGVIPDVASARVRDLSGGAWRDLAMGAADRSWPAVFAQQERRKLLLLVGTERWLAEFAGLGAFGSRRFARAQALAEAGFAPPVAALRNGLIVRRWVDAAPLDRASVGGGEHREALLDVLPRYLAFRALKFSAPHDAGASVEELARMLEVNAVEALGEAARAGARAVAAGAQSGRGAPPRPRVYVDGKLEPWEWLRTPGGRVLKTDAFQHTDGHDLVGPQPIAWDVAGAVVELALSPGETRRLLTAVERVAGVHVDAGELAFHRAAYAAFRLARWTFARDCEGDERERGRIERERAWYQAALARELSAARPG